MSPMDVPGSSTSSSRFPRLPRRPRYFAVCRTGQRLTRTTAVAKMPSTYSPAPTLTPIAATTQSDAAVVRPSTPATPSPEVAYSNMVNILGNVPLGQLMRDLHRLGAEAMVLIVTLHMLRTFFNGSAEQAISALLDDSTAKLSDAELDRLARLIEQARRSGA